MSKKKKKAKCKVTVICNPNPFAQMSRKSQAFFADILIKAQEKTAKKLRKRLKGKLRFEAN